MKNNIKRGYRMFDIMNLIIDNIWIIAAVIIVVCLIALKALGKTMGTVAKIILAIIIIASLAVALGFTTSAGLKDWVLNLFESHSASDYKDMVNNNYTGENFLK